MLYYLFNRSFYSSDKEVWLVNIIDENIIEFLRFVAGKIKQVLYENTQILTFMGILIL